MKRAFIVNLDISEADNEQVIAEDLQDAISADGYNVISVRPWKDQTDAVGIATGLGLLGTQVDPAQDNNLF